MMSLLQRFSFLTALCLLLSSCLTAELLENNETPRSVYHKEQDKLAYFAASQDGKYLIGFGEKYHYVMEQREFITKLLNSPLKTYTYSQFENVYILPKKNNEIQAGLLLALDTRKLSSKQIDEAKSLGFDFWNDSLDKISAQYQNQIDLKKLQANKQLMLLYRSLRGTLYKPKDGVNYNVNQQQYPYREAIDLSFKIGETATGNAGRMAFTPVTVAADAVLTIFAAPVVAVWLIGGGNPMDAL